MYILDGQRFFGHVVSLSNTFKQFNLTPEFIIIGINTSYPQRFRNFSNNADKFIEFMKTELLPYIENNYSVNNEKILFGWEYAGRQVRIQGDVSKIPEALAKSYFEQRNNASKIVSNTFNQGEEIESLARLQSHFLEQKEKLKDKTIERPENWGGISIKPIRIELMEFKESRLHERTLFKRIDTTWKKVILQP